ncbi:MAG: RsmD family RNA methyltransferase [Eubacteriales bacterium]
MKGAKSCTFIDECSECIDIIKKNLIKTKLFPLAIIKKGDAISLLKTVNGPFDIIFLDPPYKSLLYKEIAEIILKYHLLAENGIIVVESDFFDVLDGFNGLFKVKQKKYGNIYVTYFKEN